MLTTLIRAVTVRVSLDQHVVPSGHGLPSFVSRIPTALTPEHEPIVNMPAGLTLQKLARQVNPGTTALNPALSETDRPPHPSGSEISVYEIEHEENAAFVLRARHSWETVVQPERMSSVSISCDTHSLVG